MITDDNYLQEVKKSLNELIPSCDIEVVNNHKGNDLVITGLSIRDRESNSVVSPVIYIDPYYESQYSADECALQVYNQYLEIDELEKPDISNLMDFEWAESRIHCRLVKDDKYIAEYPHHEIAGTGLAILYSLDLAEGYSVRINKNLMDYWNTDLDELKDLCDRNMHEYKPVVQDMISAMLSASDLNYLKVETGMVDMDDEEFADWFKAEFMGDSVPMYVLTAQDKNGNTMPYSASILLRDDIYEEISQKLGGTDFYIIPSSKHELLIIDKEETLRLNMKPSRLRDVTIEVNATLDEQDILCDNIFLLNEAGLSVAEDEPELVKNNGEEI